MDFADLLTAIAVRIPKIKNLLQTEAATSNALVMPFITALGFNVTDPTEVVPEFTADFGTKKGEKVDYAIMRDGKPAMLFEVKTWNVNLDEVHASQLYRYFTVTAAPVGILTNGIVYRFFTDLEERNRMDPRPFLEFSMLELRDQVIEELKRFTRSKFDPSEIMNAASELKYTNGIKRVFAQEYAAPSEEFVRFLAKQVYGGHFTKNTKELFSDITRRAFQQFMNERIHERLQSAIEKVDDSKATPAVPKAAESAAATGGKDGVETTEDELEGFRIIRAILAELVDPSRVVLRDTKSYCGILLDDNNRKPICRLRFDTAQKYLCVIGPDKTEERLPVDGPVGIYQHAVRLRSTVQGYLAPPP